MKKLFALLTILALFLTACTGSGGQYAGPGEYDEFAQCLTEEGVKMYGAYWCPHCARQKEMFGNSWDEVAYIECSLPNRQGQTQACKMAGIQSYPTWELADGTRIGGVVQLEELSERTGCELNPQA